MPTIARTPRRGSTRVSRNRTAATSAADRVATGTATRRAASAADRQAPAAADPQATAILAVVAAIPAGRVTTYGAVAQRAGLPRRARLVGKVLSRLPSGSQVPWYRVVAAGGRIAFPDGSPSRKRQIQRLRLEGVDAS